MIPKGSINDRFYKVFSSTFLSAPKCSRTNAFFDDLQCRKTQSTFTDKHNAFLMILSAVSRKWLQNDQDTTGFIRVP